MPPSANTLFPTSRSGHRFKSVAYKSWELKAASVASKAPKSPNAFVLEAWYYIGRPDKRKRDLANYEKAVTDFLVKWGVMEDDYLIHKLVMQWDDSVPKGMVRAVIKPLQTVTPS